MDFTLHTYKNLLTALQTQGFSFQTFEQYAHSKLNSEVEEKFDQPLPANTVVKSSNQKSSNFIVLRHDVDARPQNSLRFARIQAALGIAGTYYFRMVPQSWDEAFIQEMVELGHEVGYHYETMDTCKGNVDKAYEEFCSNLEKFRQLTPVKTISMHGSPLSNFDNRDIWKKYDYKKLGIIAEPYFDIDFNQLYYLTDTGRRWDGHLYNVRDKATKENPVTNPAFLGLRFHSTRDIIKAINEGNFPEQAMLNFHPQRWNDAFLPWMKEFVWQNVKNQGKRFLVRSRK